VRVCGERVLDYRTGKEYLEGVYNSIRCIEVHFGFWIGCNIYVPFFFWTIMVMIPALLSCLRWDILFCCVTFFFFFLLLRRGNEQVLFIFISESAYLYRNRCRSLYRDVKYITL